MYCVLLQFNSTIQTPLHDSTPLHSTPLHSAFYPIPIKREYYYNTFLQTHAYVSTLFLHFLWLQTNSDSIFKSSAKSHCQCEAWSFTQLRKLHRDKRSRDYLSFDMHVHIRGKNVGLGWVFGRWIKKTEARKGYYFRKVKERFPVLRLNPFNECIFNSVWISSTKSQGDSSRLNI